MEPTPLLYNKMSVLDFMVFWKKREKTKNRQGRSLNSRVLLLWWKYLEEKDRAKRCFQKICTRPSSNCAAVGISATRKTQNAAILVRDILIALPEDRLTHRSVPLRSCVSFELTPNEMQIIPLLLDFRMSMTFIWGHGFCSICTYCDQAHKWNNYSQAIIIFPTDHEAQ